jgi:hypothetical protein
MPSASAAAQNGLVLGLVVAPVLQRVLGDHRARQTQARGALELADAVLDVVQIDHRDALEPRAVGGAEVGEPVVVGAEDRRHQRGVRHPEVEEALGGIEHFARHAVEPHVGQVLLGVVAAARHVPRKRPCPEMVSGASNLAPAWR